MRKTLFVSGLLVNLASAFSYAEEPNGEVLAASCSSCHAPSIDPTSVDAASSDHSIKRKTHLNSVAAIPTLHALSSEQILQLMIAYREDELSGTLMNRIAKGYSLGELQAIAETLAEK